MSLDASSQLQNPRIGIAFVLIGMVFISIQDVMIKQLSGDYPLHQIVFARSAIAIVFSIFLVKWEGGLSILKNDQPALHLLRALLIVVANMCYFAALAVMPLAKATALFFVAPLFITLLSIPFLGEKVGPRRVIATLVGFAGVLVMLQPNLAGSGSAPTTLVALLPVASALAYATMQILTRRLGVKAKASALAIYNQGTFILVSTGFWLIAGDGHYALGTDNQSLKFLLGPWLWPKGGDIYLFAGCGVASAVIGYSLSQAYRSANVAVVAPFEYIALPLAVLWGWIFWQDLPDAWATGGIALIIGSGLFVYLREHQRGQRISSKRPLRRW